MFTQEQLNNLDDAFRKLILPQLSTNKATLIVCRTPTFTDNVTITLFENVNQSPLATVTLNGTDWVLFGKFLRYDHKTIIQATEMIDIIVEKILGVSCGWRHDS